MWQGLGVEAARSSGKISLERKNGMRMAFLLPEGGEAKHAMYISCVELNTMSRT